MLSWEIYRDFREDTYLRSLLERVAEARNGKVLGNLGAGFSYFGRFLGVFRIRMENFREMEGWKTPLRLEANVLAF